MFPGYGQKSNEIWYPKKVLVGNINAGDYKKFTAKPQGLHFIKNSVGEVKEVRIVGDDPYNSKGDAALYDAMYTGKNKFPKNVAGRMVEKVHPDYTETTWPVIVMEFKNSAGKPIPNPGGGGNEWMFAEEFFKAAMGKPSNDKDNVTTAYWKPLR